MSGPRTRALALLALSAALAGCEHGDAPTGCSFGAEHTIAETVAKGYEAIDVVGLKGGQAAFWSEPAGLFARAVSADGAPRGPVLRIGPRCPGGLSALSAPDAVHVACLVHPAGERGEESGVVVIYDLDAELRLRGATNVGDAGPLSRGVALADVAGVLQVAWHDGSTEAQHVRFARLDAPDRVRLLSGQGNVAGAPSMTVLDGEVRVAWAERWLEGEELESRVMLWTGDGAPREVLGVHHLAAMPQLLTHQGRLLLAVRDYRRGGSRAGLYLAYLDETGRPLGEPARIARADGVYRPSLTSCLDGLVAATPRTYGGDYFVGVAWLDHELARPRPEQQFYEDSHAFTRAAAGCVGDQALLVIAEHGALDAPITRLRAVPYLCR